MFTGKSIMKMSDYLIMYDEKEKCQNIISKRSHQCWKIMKISDSYRLFLKEKDVFVPHGAFDTPLECVMEIAAYDDKLRKKNRRNNNALSKFIQEIFDKPATV